MTCQQCGRELPPGTHPRTQFCRSCIRERHIAGVRKRALQASIYKTCLRCGRDLEPGSCISKRYCANCSAEMAAELKARREQEKAKKAATAAALVQAARDRAYCRDCVYSGMSEYSVNLCDYLLKTGKQRGCKAGEGCPKQKRRAVHELAK